MNENQAKKVSHNAWGTVPQAANNLCDKQGRSLYTLKFNNQQSINRQYGER